MIAVDTNILAYAHRPESEFHERARNFVRSLAEGDGEWAIPWPCVHEFLALVTHPRVFKQPTATVDALDQVSAWLDSPTARLIGERDGYYPVLRSVLERGVISGPKVHDARIVAVCLVNGVTRLCSADRDFSRFGAALPILNPL